MTDSYIYENNNQILASSFSSSDILSSILSADNFNLNTESYKAKWLQLYALKKGEDTSFSVQWIALVNKSLEQQFVNLISL